MKAFRTPTRTSRLDQSGINMVDLMMWLVIAALLLAAALQGIGYYQRAAFVHQMESDASGAGSVAFGTVADQGGSFTLASVQAAVDSANWSRGMVRTVENPSNGAKPFIRVSHPNVTSSDVIYLFEPCGSLAAGANLVPKGGNADLSACGISPSVIAVTMTQRITGNHLGVAMSDDGQKMITGAGGVSRARLSTDSGVTWATNTTMPLGSWRSFASSADGNKLMAGMDGGTLYTSTNSGATWTSATGPGTGTWYAMASSSDGTKLVAGKDGGSIYTSADSGATWTSRPGAGVGAWRSIASSGDGTRLVAVSGGASSTGNVFTSSDAGVTWTSQAVPGTSNWVGASSSKDGTKLAVVANYNYVYTSADSGATWVRQTKSGNGVWTGIASSADGTKLVAIGSTMKVSTDSGVNWTPQTSSGSNSLQSVALSADGNKILAGTSVAGAGALYTGSY